MNINNLFSEDIVETLQETGSDVTLSDSDSCFLSDVDRRFPESDQALRKPPQTSLL
jgi:hypothetical protein